jgi:hypothetical protein
MAHVTYVRDFQGRTQGSIFLCIVQVESASVASPLLFESTHLSELNRRRNFGGKKNILKPVAWTPRIPAGLRVRSHTLSLEYQCAEMDSTFHLFMPDHSI